jgi:hypothetical protein
MVQLNSLAATRASKTFGTTINGEVNRIVRAVWRNMLDSEDDLVLVGERTNYMGNFFLPSKYPCNEAGINDYANVIRAKLADGTLKMVGYTFTVAALTNNTHKGFKNLATQRISRNIDRAFKEGTSESAAFQAVKADLERAANKEAKTIEWVDE